MFDLDTERRARPGPMMIGPYNISQLDDFYEALARCEVTTAGVMHFVQRLLIADGCEPGARVVDIGCGRGLQLPTLYQYARFISSYIGLDIVPINLAKAYERAAALDIQHDGCPFGIEFIKCDISAPWPTEGLFDVAIYTSVLERLPREHGIASFRQVSQRLAPDGDPARLAELGTLIRRRNIRESVLLNRLSQHFLEKIIPALAQSVDLARRLLTANPDQGPQRLIRSLTDQAIGHLVTCSNAMAGNTLREAHDLYATAVVIRTDRP